MRHFLVLVLTLSMLGPGLASLVHDQGPILGENVVHRFVDVDASMTAWEDEFPDFVERFEIGTSATLLLPIYGVTITDESKTAASKGLQHGRKYQVLLDGGHHGNEFFGVELLMYAVEEWLDGVRTSDPEVLQLLATHEITIIPMVNPEGNLLGTRKSANQVDLNRNWGYEWGGPGSGDLLVDPTYRGPSAMSEPEVQALASLARSVHPDLWITTHTGVAEFYWPWGWTHDPTPDDVFFSSLEGPFENATGGTVDAMQAAELYLAAGATDDWGYGELGVPTHTFEVHPDQNIPIYGQPIPDLIQNQLHGLRFMVENTQRMGAWLNLHEIDGDFHVYNAGWGEARNISVFVDGELDRVIESLAPGEMIEWDGIPGKTMQAEYTHLLADWAKPAVASFTSPTGATQETSEAEPAGAPIVVLGILLLAGLALRKKSL